MDEIEYVTELLLNKLDRQQEKGSDCISLTEDEIYAIVGKLNEFIIKVIESARFD